MSEATPTPEVAAGEQQPTPEKSAQPDYLSMMPEAIQAQVKEMKARVGSVFMTFLGDAAFLFRTINVLEWRMIQKAQEQAAQAQGATEELLQEQLFKTIVVKANLGVIVTDNNGKEHLMAPLNPESISATGAGVPSSLAQQIMYQSGFDQNPMTVKL